MRLLIREGVGGGGGGGGGGQDSEGSTVDTARKRSETVDCHRNNGRVKAVSPRHCAATSAQHNYCFNCRAG